MNFLAIPIRLKPIDTNENRILCRSLEVVATMSAACPVRWAEVGLPPTALLCSLQRKPLLILKGVSAWTLADSSFFIKSVFMETSRQSQPHSISLAVKWEVSFSVGIKVMFIYITGIVGELGALLLGAEVIVEYLVDVAL